MKYKYVGFIFRPMPITQPIVIYACMLLCFNWSTITQAQEAIDDQIGIASINPDWKISSTPNQPTPAEKQREEINDNKDLWQEFSKLSRVQIGDRIVELHLLGWHHFGSNKRQEKYEKFATYINDHDINPSTTRFFVEGAEKPQEKIDSINALYPTQRQISTRLYDHLTTLTLKPLDQNMFLTAYSVIESNWPDNTLVNFDLINTGFRKETYDFIQDHTSKDFGLDMCFWTLMSALFTHNISAHQATTQELVTQEAIEVLIEKLGLESLTPEHLQQFSLLAKGTDMYDSKASAFLDWYSENLMATYLLRERYMRHILATQAKDGDIVMAHPTHLKALLAPEPKETDFNNSP